ncbi:MAG: hypothetical protein QNK37_20660 [Acidobacteriota bacterium]|nr:hypothetical protein [Acidobacteriota bacterium]
MNVFQIIEQHRRTPFQWNTFDCCTLASIIIEAATGQDFRPRFKDRYKTQRGAARFMNRWHRDRGRNSKQSDLADIVNDLLAELTGPHCNRKRCAPGDLVLADLENGPTLGLCAGTHAYFPGPDGLTAVPMNRARCGWRLTTCRKQP